MPLPSWIVIFEKHYFSLYCSIFALYLFKVKHFTLTKSKNVLHSFILSLKILKKVILFFKNIEKKDIFKKGY